MMKMCNKHFIIVNKTYFIACIFICLFIFFFISNIIKIMKALLNGNTVINIIKRKLFPCYCFVSSAYVMHITVSTPLIMLSLFTDNGFRCLFILFLSVNFFFYIYILGFTFFIIRKWVKF